MWNIKFTLGLGKRHIWIFMMWVIRLERPLRPSPYEPGNRAGSVSGAKFGFCSYGKFQPC